MRDAQPLDAPPPPKTAFPELSVLSLRGHRLGKEGVASLREDFDFPNLEQLDLGGAVRRSDCPEICHQLLASPALSGRFPRLRGLTLDGWDVRADLRADNDVPFHLSKAFPGLTRLSFGCTDHRHLCSASNAFAASVAARFPGLRELELSGSADALDAGGLRRVLDGLPELRVLRVVIDIDRDARPRDADTPPFPELFECTAHLDEYTPHTCGSLRATRPDTCAGDRIAEYPHVYRRARRAPHDDFDPYARQASGAWPVNL